MYNNLKYDGRRGPRGYDGERGERGKEGPIGLMGLPGPIGPTGLTGPPGLTGPLGLTGPIGPIGVTGLTGPPGLTGPIGLTGSVGPIGLPGPIGPTGSTGLTGPQGLIGLTGATGLTGLPGPQGLSGIFSAAEFYIIAPSPTIAPGTAINFPNDGPSFGTDIIRFDSSHFSLGPGIYQIYFQASITEAGQLCIALNNIETSRIVGRSTGTSQLMSFSLIQILANTLLSIVNPVTETTALTLTPFAGGTNQVFANIVISRIY